MFKIVLCIIHPLQRKARKPLSVVLEQNAKVMIRELMIVFGVSLLYFLCMCVWCRTVALHCHHFVVIGSFHCRRAKPSLDTVLFINLLRKGLTPRACMRDRESHRLLIWVTKSLRHQLRQWWWGTWDYYKLLNPYIYYNRTQNFWGYLLFHFLPLIISKF